MILKHTVRNDVWSECVFTCGYSIYKQVFTSDVNVRTEYAIHLYKKVEQMFAIELASEKPSPEWTLGIFKLTNKQYFSDENHLSVVCGPVCPGHRKD